MDKKIRKKNLGEFSSLKQFITKKGKTVQKKIETTFFEANQPRFLRNVNFVARGWCENTLTAAIYSQETVNK